MRMSCGVYDTDGEDRRVRAGCGGSPHLVVVPTRAAPPGCVVVWQASRTLSEEATARCGASSADPRTATSCCSAMRRTLSCGGVSPTSPRTRSPGAPSSPATAAPPGTSTSKCRRRELTAPPSIIIYAWIYKRYRSDRRSSAPRPPASWAWCFQDTVLFHASIRSVLACRFEQQSARPSRPDKGRNSNQHRSSTMTQQASWRQRRIGHGVPVCPCRAPFCTSSKPAAIRSAADRPEPANLRPATGHNSMTRSRADSAICADCN